MLHVQKGERRGTTFPILICQLLNVLFLFGVRIEKKNKMDFGFLGIFSKLKPFPKRIVLGLLAIRWMSH